MVPAGRREERAASVQGWGAGGGLAGGCVGGGGGGGSWTKGLRGAVGLQEGAWGMGGGGQPGQRPARRTQMPVSGVDGTAGAPAAQSTDS